MSLALVLDAETTGFDAPEVISLATTVPLAQPSVDVTEIPVALQMFRPSKPIALGALAIHHIIEDDLQDYALWPGSWTPPAGVEFLIAHNVDYDWKAIGSPNVARICTLALSCSLWPDLDSHSLGALTYHFQGQARGRELLKSAHSADHDVRLCLLVLREILLLLPGIEIWPQLWEASEKARVPVFMSFGKYGPHEAWAKANGGPMRCAEVSARDPGYYSWLMSKCDQVRDDPYLRKALTGEAS